MKHIFTNRLVTASVLLAVLAVGCSTGSSISRKQLTYGPVNILSILNQNTNSVVREFNTQIEIKKNGKAAYRVKKAVTVLNDEARHQGILVLHYDQYRSIKSVDGALYDGKGNFLRRLDDDDIEDYGNTSSYSLYDDSRVRFYELYGYEYPYTVVYEYELEIDGLLNIPSWIPQLPHEYVEEAELIVKAPLVPGLRYKAVNMGEDSEEPEYSNTENAARYRWSVEGLMPDDHEPFAPGLKKSIPRVLIASNAFDMGGHKGSLESWSAFGDWYYRLAEGRDELPSSLQEEVEEIYNSAGSKREGIEQLYTYMQGKTRYVSIQLGIGGWQPYDAAYVEEKGYGDCKALTNYMYAILKHVGVESYPVLIRSGHDEPLLTEDFPSNQFNHVVLMVPMEKDTLWLENTSQSMPFNYIGMANANRYGLAIKEGESFLVRTPEYDHRKNRLANELKLHIDSEGRADIEAGSTVSGYYLDELIHNTAQKSDYDREEWLYKTFSLSAFEIKNADFSDIDAKSRTPRMQLDLTSLHYATRTGSRLFIPVNKINRWENPFPKMESERTKEVDLQIRFHEEDRSTILMPEGFKLESVPAEVSMENDFGKYSLNFNPENDGSIEVIRNLEISKRMLPAERYEDVRQFFESVSAYDNMSIVLVSR